MAAIEIIHEGVDEEKKRELRMELRQVPTWKLVAVHEQLVAGKKPSYCCSLIKSNSGIIRGFIEEILWERGKKPTKRS